MKYALTAIGLALLSAPAFAAESTFQKSCDNIKLSSDGLTITADCRKQDGSVIPASIPVRNVENIDGKLTVTQAETSYQKSCTNHQFLPEKANLAAICMMANGHPNKTNLILENIENIDGVLTQN